MRGYKNKMDMTEKIDKCNRCKNKAEYLNIKQGFMGNLTWEFLCEDCKLILNRN